MFGLGAGEIVVIVLIILLLFGGRKIPEVMRGLGHGLREFRKATSEATADIKRAVDETPADKPAETEPPTDDKS